MTDLTLHGPAGLNLRSASEASRLMAAGEIKSEGLIGDCLARIRVRDADIGAWTHIDPEYALDQARDRDGEARSGPLHGIPVGIKDVFDTYDMPTAYGSVIHRGHRPDADTGCVATLRDAGAVVLGKTATTEFASPVPVGVRNPHDFGRSPGVSSSGSAAAVADFMVPVALGTQTGGSVILPAAFCGLYGYKPTLEAIDRTGLRHVRPSLDTIGLLARGLDDIALIFAGMTGRDPAPTGDPPRIGICRTMHWSASAAETVAALDATQTRLGAAGAAVEQLELPAIFDGIEETFTVIASVEGGRAMAPEERAQLDRMNHWLKDAARFAATVTEDAYQAALAHAVSCRDALGALFDHVDLLITPSTIGEATDDLTGVTHSPFNRLWTLMHGPCLTIPAFSGPNGLPVGIQLVGRPGADEQMLTHAAWIDRQLG